MNETKRAAQSYVINRQAALTEADARALLNAHLPEPLAPHATLHQRRFTWRVAVRPVEHFARGSLELKPFGPEDVNGVTQPIKVMEGVLLPIHVEASGA